MTVAARTAALTTRPHASAPPSFSWHDFPWSASWLADDLTPGTFTTSTTWLDAQAGVTLKSRSGSYLPVAYADGGALNTPRVQLPTGACLVTPGTFTLNQPDSIVVVFTQDTSSGATQFVTDAQNNSNRHLMYVASNTLAVTTGNGGTATTTGGITAGVWHIVIGTFNTPNVSAYIDDGTYQATASGSSTRYLQGLTVGGDYNGSRTLLGSYAAVGTYNGVVSDDAMFSQLLDYVTTKWGITTA